MATQSPIALMQEILATQVGIYSAALAALPSAPTAYQASAAIPVLDGVEDALQALRTTLDALDPTTVIPYTSGINYSIILLDVWKWDREVRHSIVRVYQDIYSIRSRLMIIVYGAHVTRHTVISTDSIQDVAVMYYNDWSQYTKILKYNGIIPGTALVPGSVLVIPDPLRNNSREGR